MGFEALAALKFNKVALYRPYGHPTTLKTEGWSKKPWQFEFHAAGARNPERLLMAANGVGKTMCGAAETALHLTGLYPEWWTGRRFDKPVNFWVGSISNQTQRDYTQPALFGSDLGENLGSGMVPKDRIVGKPRTRQAGMPDVLDIARVRHASGGNSTVLMKTYEQGWRAWQGAAPDGIWMDEQPDENAANEKMIFSEAQTRVFRSGGILYMTLTPLLGETDMIRHFTNPKAGGIWWVGATWDDAPHLQSEDKERLKATYPEHEVQVRTMGLPMMGEGRVFTISEEAIRCKPFEIPSWYAVICGVDFGIDHPAAAVWIAWDRDNDVIYVTDCYKQSGETSVYHAEAIKRRGGWIPVAWPHDGLNREKSGGKQLKDAYADHGLRMLSKSARYPKLGAEPEKGGAQPVEPIIQEVLERMKTGRLKVFDTLHPWFDEFRSYHRKDGRLVARNDDVLKATFYAVMMKRYAAPRTMSVPEVDMGPVATVML